jgi:hypothetical protein
MKSFFALVLTVALFASPAAKADTNCSVLSFQQAFAVTMALDLLMDGGQKIQLLNDNTGNVREISQAIATPILNGYTVSVLTSDNQWEQLDIGHITAINQTSQKSVSLGKTAGCL